MRIVVTGATSFIGRAVVEELLKQGQKVYAVARPGSAGLSFLKALPLNGQEGRREGAVGSVRILECNLNEIERLKEMDITDASAWLHLGWEGAGSANRQDPALQAKNIGYALSAVRTAGALGCSRFLFSGSQAEYGICDSPMREDQPCHPVSEYGKDKVLVCRQAGELAGQLHMDYIHTRIFRCSLCHPDAACKGNPQKDQDTSGNPGSQSFRRPAGNPCLCPANTRPSGSGRASWD